MSSAEIIETMSYEEFARWGSFIECLEFILHEAKKRNISVDDCYKKINVNRIVEYIDSKSDYYIRKLIQEDEEFI